MGAIGAEEEVERDLDLGGAVAGSGSGFRLLVLVLGRRLDFEPGFAVREVGAGESVVEEEGDVG